MNTGDFMVLLFLLAGAFFSIIRKKLTKSGAILAVIIGWFVYKGAGLTGICMLVVFFLTATLATGWQLKKKKHLYKKQENAECRTAGQVFANGGVAAILGGLAWLLPQYAVPFQVMLAGSIASAMADTLSSELGTVYGRRFYDIVSFKKVNAGPDGVISLEGTLIGFAGACLIATVFALGNESIRFVFVIILAGIFGNFVDSLLGATLERRNIIGNNVVNFLNTLSGSIACFLFLMLYYKYL